MLLSTFLAVVAVVITHFMWNIDVDASSGQFLNLVTLFLIMGEPILSKALAVTDTIYASRLMWMRPTSALGGFLGRCLRSLQQEDLAGTAVNQYDYTASLEIVVLVDALAGFSMLSMFIPHQTVLLLLAILTFGTIGNVLTVTLPRNSGAHGIQLKSVEVTTNENKVMAALQMLEQKYEGCSEPLHKDFFPAGLSYKELSWLTNLQDSRKRAAKALEKARKQAAVKGHSKKISELTSS
jgi:hypothetical protein